MKRKIHLLIAVFILSCMVPGERTDLYNMFANEVMAESANLMVENWSLDPPNGGPTLNLYITFSDDVNNADQLTNYSIKNYGYSVRLSSISPIAPNSVKIALYVPPSYAKFTISTVSGPNPIKTAEGQILTNQSETFEINAI